MDKSLKWRTILIVVVIAISCLYLIPSAAKLPSWWGSTFPSEKIALGLDLQGGMHLLLMASRLKQEGAFSKISSRISPEKSISPEKLDEEIKFLKLKSFNLQMKKLETQEKLMLARSSGKLEYEQWIDQ